MSAVDIVIKQMDVIDAAASGISSCMYCLISLSLSDRSIIFIIKHKKGVNDPKWAEMTPNIYFLARIINYKSNHKS
jgi:hypothetical protein